MMEYLRHSRAILTLNFSGLYLGKKLLPFIDVLYDNKSLMQVNLSNNLLTDRDEEFIADKLGC